MLEYLKSITARLEAFFRELWAELERLYNPDTEQKATAKEIHAILRGKNKNELMRILNRLSSDYTRSLPEIFARHKRAVKQQHSKNDIIDGIMRLLAIKYATGAKNVDSRSA